MSRFHRRHESVERTTAGVPVSCGAITASPEKAPMLTELGR
jgi:hypothetical protein